VARQQLRLKQEAEKVEKMLEKLEQKSSGGSSSSGGGEKKASKSMGKAGQNMKKAAENLVKRNFPKSKEEQYRKINDMSFEEKQSSVGKTVSTVSSASSTGDQDLSGDYIYYTIRSGDTLWEIAQKYSGVTDTDIMELNKIKNAGQIRPGQVIKIKRKG